MSRFLFLCLFLPVAVFGQRNYTMHNTHAHNDYEHPIPFLSAYYLNFGSIEADVFARHGRLMVSHTEQDIDTARSLERLYLNPLADVIRKNGGTAYKNSHDTLQLMIDFKTPGDSTMPVLVKLLSRYPSIINNPTVIITISGDQPLPATWSRYPSYIHFDGKRSGVYTAAQLARIPMYSEDIKAFTPWNGKGIIVQSEKDVLIRWIDSVHQLGKKLRLWGVADNVNTWKTQMHLNVDYIGTDQLDNLSTFLSNRKAMEYHGSMTTHSIYPARYVNNDSLSEVRNVILLIGDGMGLTQIYAGLTGNQGKLNLLQMMNIGFSKTYSADDYITDSAAGGTAMATGHKTNNRYISMLPNGEPVPAIPALIAPRGYSSGIISMGPITDATPAVFYAHVADRSHEDSIAAQFINSPVQVLIGGGAQHFRNIDTLPDFKKRAILSTQAEYTEQNGRRDFLRTSLEKTMQALSSNKKGFFIMAEGAQIDYGGHANNVPYVVTEMMDFDDAIGAAMKFADEDGHTLIIVTADHETGGLSLLDGNFTTGYVDGHFSTNDHTAVMVPVFAYGPHSLDFRGVYENTAIFEKIMKLLK
jgi:alkaline phosphatase